MPLIHFAAVLAIFGVVYFGLCLPAFQRYSAVKRGRRFTVRLGGAWQWSNPQHRWDVLMSFLSFAVALGLSMLIWDQLVQQGYLPAFLKE